MTQKKPILSIITVNWNGLEYLKKLVDSIEKFTKDYELIIVDNCSTDGSREYIESAIKKNYRIEAIGSNENIGWVGGINKGLKFVKGEYICFINNDIEVTENWFEQMKEHFNDKKEKVGMVGCTSDFTMGLQKHDLNDRINGNHHKVNYLIGWLILTKREVLEKIAKQDKKLIPINGMAGLDPIFGIGSSDDLDLSLRARKAGYSLFIAREVFVKHHGSKSFEKMFGGDLYQRGTKANKDYMADVDAKLDILRKKWGEKEVKELLTINLPIAKFRGTIGIPHGELLPHKFHTDLMSLHNVINVKVAHVYGSLIQKARNDIAKAMEGDWLIFIDSDMTFAPDTIDRLLKAAERKDVDIISAACFRKVPMYEPCFFWRIPDENTRYYRKMRWPKDKLFEVDATGSACTLIKRKVFETVPFPWYEYNNALSEDLNFCRKAKEYGFRVWVDPGIKVGHLTMLPINDAVFEAFNAKTLKEYDREKKEFGEEPFLYKLKNNIK